MERWRGRVAVVTGAGSGIGAGVAYALQDAGMTVVGLDLHGDRIEGAVASARKGAQERGRAAKSPAAGALHALKCDVRSEEDIVRCFKWVDDHVGGTSVLVNCAGRCGDRNLTEAEGPTEWRDIIDINVLGLSICTREAIRSLRAKGIDDGHIVNFASIAAYDTELLYPVYMYAASKHAVRVLTEGLRKELVAANSKIRVSEVSPGWVKTNIDKTFTHTFADTDPKDMYQWPLMHPEDIADIVLFQIGAPPHVQVHEVIVRPVGQEI